MERILPLSSGYLGKREDVMPVVWERIRGKELLVRNWKGWTGRWRSYRGQINLDM
jgi:hypothetical protein